MTNIWKTKLAARLHDPAEKALVLLRDPAGHEGGTVAELRNKFGIDAPNKTIRNADHWSAAADRPQWPTNESDGAFASWTQVRFDERPILIHPLTGREFDLKSLCDIDYKEIKAVSLEHFSNLEKLANNDDRLAYLAFWRFGPELDENKKSNLGPLWRVLPADTRVPEHSIWNHLDTVSAFAGSMSESTPALLSMSFGPVQSFIAQSRSTSDLWAGSHLLSMLVWEAMRAIAEEIGPDVFIFPQIRGLAIVDMWLLELAKQAGADSAWQERFKDSSWFNKATDSNPLFAASLPNKFLALVPRNKLDELAQKATNATRKAAAAWAFEAAKIIAGQESGYWQNQLNSQLKDFPQVFWAGVDWPQNCQGQDLEDFLESYYSTVVKGSEEDLWHQPVWQLLSKEIIVEGKKFFEPNPGILYPAVFALSERSLAIAKTLRTFEQNQQSGFRCTLCAEREWLTDNPEKLALPPGARRSAETLWNSSAGSYGIKNGEHLCAVCALKRMWGKIFVDRVKSVTQLENLTQYKVSTHAMALATTLESLIDKFESPELNSQNNARDLQACDKLNELIPEGTSPVALPKKLAVKLNAKSNGNPKLVRVIKCLPSALDAASDEIPAFEEQSSPRLQKFERIIKDLTGKSLEKYYALLLMDGDFMGAWLSGNKERLPFKACWHPQIRNKVENDSEKSAALNGYLNSLRPASPARHAAISQALNSFSSILAPYIMEELVKGKLLYAGGDDVMAMVSVDELFKAMAALRLSYSGIEGEFDNYLRLKNGFAKLGRNLMQVMGEKATASIGAVVVHHQTPLALALKSLREAEQTAKKAGRNAFCIRILKRSGGEVAFTDHWWNPNVSNPSQSLLFENTTFGTLCELKNEFAASEGLSRRAAYSAEEWLKGLPTDEAENIASTILAHQFKRHGGKAETAVKAVQTVWNSSGIQNSARRESLVNLLSIAEFFARESRS